MPIRRCPIWLLGIVVVTLALGTSTLMATRAYVAGEVASIRSALFATPLSESPRGAATLPAAAAALKRGGTASVAQAGATSATRR